MADETLKASLATRREFVIGGALAATAAMAPLLTPRNGPVTQSRSGRLDRIMPDTIGPWQRSGLEGVLIPKGEQRDGEAYDDVITRYFVSNSAAPILLLIAYGSAQAGNAALHRPEVCYPAAGFKLRKWPDLSIPLQGRPAIAARSLTALATSRVEEILYWSRIGNEFPTSSIGQRWSTLSQSLSGSIPDGILVRISTINQDRDRAVPTLKAFAKELLSSGDAELHQFLTGGR